MTQDPTYLFCVGATKSGTSWLHAHLSGHSECHFRKLKEMHYFGLSTPAQFGAALRAGRQEMVRLTARLADPAHGNPATAQRLADLRDWQKVLRIKAPDLPAYRAFLTNHRGAAHVVGDITPAYALLPVETLGSLRAVGADVRVVYLMRDPLARLWSHIRMLAKRATPQDFGRVALALLDRILGRDPTAEAKGVIVRGDYATVVPKLSGAFEQKRLLMMFYEDLVTLPGVAKMSAFLGITPGQANFDQRVHKGVSLDLPAEARIRALAFLRPQYDFVARHFGQVPQAWRANMIEGMV